MIKSILLLSFLISASSLSAKTRLAITEFKDKSGDTRCSLRRYYRRNRLGKGMTEQLVSELVKAGRFKIQERQHLKKMYRQEHQLINASRKHAPQKNQFKAAHFSIAGAVTSFELCAGGIGGKVDVGKLFGFKKTGLKVGGGKSEAKVAIDIRVIDVETAEVFTSFTVEGKSTKMALALGGKYKGAAFDSGAFKNSPIGEATRDAIRNAVERLRSEIPNKKDPPNLQLASKNQPTEQSVTGASRDNERSQKIGAYGVTTKMNQICGYRWRNHYQMCKTVKRSKTGKRLQVLQMVSGSKAVLTSDKVFKIAKNKSPKVGDDVLISCLNNVSHCAMGRKEKYGFRKCVVVDSFDNETVVTCKGKELQVDTSEVYNMRALSTFKKKRRQVAANK